MNRRETAEVLFRMQANYRNAFSKMGEESINMLVETWETAFKDHKKDVVVNALIRAMLTKKDYPPTIADVGEEIVALKHPGLCWLDGDQAWAKAVEIAHDVDLRRVVPNAEAEYARSETATKAAQDNYPLVWNAMVGVGGPDGFLEANTTLRAQFIRMYNSYRQRELKRLLIPVSLKTQSERMDYPGIAGLAERGGTHDR